MESTKIKFWLKLALVIVTSFITITYIFTPSDNQCKMTFMQEPPKFIPVPIDNRLHNLDAHQPMSPEQSLEHGYKLFMYSEQGFPHKNGIRHDFRDSMPVLFVPGNAGSYQQVRSLASRCIKRQIDFLDAFKFIFYTIDFQAHLSGLSGELVENQIEFLNAALNEISRRHRSETSGVIIVGHSIGGFIAKALLTKPDFDANLVPLLIDLASPLTRPFVYFDHKMQELYENTTAQWSTLQRNSRTFTMSISGGKSDRLVPVHLSLDPQYDISLTTSSIDGMWLTTDHVSITWCWELMEKLSRTMSALMDKKHTRLIEGKSKQLEVVKRELLTASPSVIDINDVPVKTEPRRIITDNIKQFDEDLSLRRGDLLNSPVILDMTSRSVGDLFLWTEYHEPLRDSSIFGCQKVHFSNNQAQCSGRMNLMPHSSRIPTRRYELNKSSLTIRDDTQQLKYLILDFSYNSRDDPRKIPEFISIQVIKPMQPKMLSVPTFSNYILSILLDPSKLIINVQAPLSRSRVQVSYKLENLHLANQYYNLMLESSSCTSNDIPSEMSALLTKGDYVTDSFHVGRGDVATVTIKLGPKQTIIMADDSYNLSDTYLALNIDGTCQTKMRFKFDYWSFIENFIQTYPGEILACSTYIAYAAIIAHTSQLIKVEGESSSVESLWDLLTWWIKFYLVYITSRLEDRPSSDVPSEVLLFVVVVTLSCGLVALVEYVINRLVDLATIVHGFQTFIQHRIMDCCSDGENSSESTSNGAGVQTKVRQLDYEWPTVILTALGSLFISVVLMRICVLFMMLKIMLKLSLAMRPGDPVVASSSSNGSAHMRAHSTISPKLNQPFANAYNLVLSVTILSVISSICSIPATLLRFSSPGFSFMIDENYMISLGSMIMMKSISQRIESHAFKAKGTIESRDHTMPRLLAYSLKYFHILGLLPMRFISRNIRVLNPIELVTLVWVAGSLIKANEKGKTSKRKTE